MAASRSWKMVRDPVAGAIRERLWLGKTDTVITEVATAESRSEALKRLRQLKGDAQRAMEIIVSMTR